MIRDYQRWPFEPQKKSTGATLYGMITKAQHEHLKEFKYDEDGKEVTIRLEATSQRTAEMLY